ncbi:DUF421 domain-containing protein [Desulfitobacterium metallireducens]|uniref:DUF421 domain-containing protein n=1 Tax=Desulfitobacterium metallireducens DSM 15288 TaxID=871968 RepID=W0E6T7_9FIRM|nr:DUF421 domain-containing protein [Desulfitobacterium metallireducens]AHF06482.1 hypothetical protein DESME_04970 [Desulfitobacterium metallireducens DSM 15288]
MDFLKSQDSLTALEWILRSIVSFVFLLLLAKVMGQRSISQLRFLDFIIALILGNIIAHPLSDEQLGLKGSMITSSVLIVLYVLATWLSLKWTLFRRFVDPPPFILIKNGAIQFQNLSKARISIDYLFSELRKEKIEDIQKVALAVWEPGGTISIFRTSQYEPLTPADMKLETEEFTLTRPIIAEGEIDLLLLKEIGRDQTWLKERIGPIYKEIQDVPLATIDGNENVRIYSKSDY